MGAIPYILVICLVIVSIGLYGNYETVNSTIKPLVQQYVPASIRQEFPTGDTMTLNLQPLGNVQTISSGQAPITTPYYNPTNNSVPSSNIAVPTPQNQSTLLTTAGQTFGSTQNNKEVLPTDTFQLGDPVAITGNIQMVIPNSCVNLNGQISCQYVSPAIWKYLLQVSCKIDQNDNCAMDDIPHWGTTDGSGNYNFTWYTNSGSMNAGPYLISISANSLVKSPQGEPYTWTQNKLVNLSK